MKKIVLSILIILFGILSVNAQNNSSKYNINPALKLLQPDTKLSKKEIKQKKNLAMLVCNNIDERADSLYFKLSKEEFLTKSKLPIDYYNEIERNIKDINLFLRKDVAKNTSAAEIKQQMIELYNKLK